MRTALRYTMTEHHALERKVIYTTGWAMTGAVAWNGAPMARRPSITGRGIGNDYWDILPFGGLDAYATIQYYDAVRVLADIEREILAHPEWNDSRRRGRVSTRQCSSTTPRT